MPRSQPGERNGNAILTDKQAEMIRGLYRSSFDTQLKFWTARQLAETFEVSEATIRGIVRHARRP